MYTNDKLFKNSYRTYLSAVQKALRPHIYSRIIECLFTIRISGVTFKEDVCIFIAQTVINLYKLFDAVYVTVHTYIETLQ